MTIRRQIINNCYHTPRGYLKTLSRFGIINYLLMQRGMREMEHASQRLTFSDAKPVFEVHFLTGRRFLYQTLFCIYSLEKQSGQTFLTHLYDDGSLDLSTIERIKGQLPNVRIHLEREIEERLQRYLPTKSFPYLNHKRNVYPHIKKLIDIHCGTTGRKLVLDSDMLFYNPPMQLLAWLKNSDKPVYMLDSDYAYGFPKDAIENTCGKKIPDYLNVGVIGLESSKIDWQRIEDWAKQLESNYGNSYYLEQALTAMVIGETECDILAKSEYVVYPKTQQEEEYVLSHFVDLSKALYFRKAWRKI